MKRILHLGLITLSFLFLAGCYSHRNPNFAADLTRETWMREVDVSPTYWARGADNWFMSGNANATEIMDRNAPVSAAISTMMVRVPFFNNIRVNGDFQVQMIGVYGPNSVTLYGPNDGVRDVVVDVRGNTLCLTQVKNARHIRQVIVRIGVNQLNNLVQMGCGSIEGINLHSSSMNIITTGPGNVFIGGPVNLSHVLNKGGGIISVFGAKTYCLDIMTVAGGSVNISGDISVRSITHHGRANINIIGAHSPGLKIKADGMGKVGLYGFNINLRNIVTKDAVRVYAYNVNSSGMYAYAYGNSRIGLAGYAANVFVDTYKSAQFGGRSLCVQNAYVRAHDWSHINVSASGKMFAAATQNASVFFYGPPGIMSQFVNGNGVVMPIFAPGFASCAVERTSPYSYKGENSAEPAPTYGLRYESGPANEGYSSADNAARPTRTYVPHETSEVPFTASTRTVAKSTPATTAKPVAKPQDNNPATASKIVGQG